jgi:hypothetical protein
MYSAASLKRGAMPMPVRNWETLLFGIVGLTFVVGPSVVDGQIPGNLGDARFNSYLLEHFFHWITGRDGSFWNADFYYPYPLTIAFSDNFLGNAFVYALFRAVGFAREDAFRLWYAAGFVINFAAADYALVRFGYSRLAAALGSFLFTFGLPVMAQEGHAQLVYRFGVPLAVLTLEEFKSRRRLRQLVLVAFWTTWQFYCSIYTGYFLTLLLLALVLGHSLCHGGGPVAGIQSLAFGVRRLWTSRATRARVAFLAVMAVPIALMVVLLVPYVEVGRLYGFHRQWAEIAMMLPRPASYLLAIDSRFWPSTGPLFDTLPMWWEHAMFIGIGPFVAFAVAVTLRLAGRTRWDRLFAPAALAVVILVLLTLWVDGHSAYRMLSWLPGPNAIRAVTRIVTVLLFPCGILLASSLDAIATARLPGWIRSSTLALIGASVVFEASFITHDTATKRDWQSRMAAVAAELPAAIPQAPILLLAPKPGQFAQWPRELDAMLFAQDRGWRTLNGYSGNVPQGHLLAGGCQDAAAHDLAAGLAFLGDDTDLRYDELVRHVVMVGHPTCDTAALPRHPQVSMFAGPAPAELMAKVTLRIERLEVQDGQIIIAAFIDNASSVTLPAYSTTAMPLRLSTRFVDTHATPQGLEQGAGWDSRQDIAFDILPGTSQQVTIPIAPPAEPGTYRVAVSMVQDGVAWFHDHGLHIPISAQTVTVDKDHTAHVSDGVR